MSFPAEAIFKKLYASFGPQAWWPAKTPFEVMVGAILTQNTAWANVERAIANLQDNNALRARALYLMPRKKIASLIRPAGYYNIKAKRLKNFLKFFFREYSGSVRKMAGADIAKLRRQLLSVNGIGEETADSILLYALNKPVFVVDAYTKRIFARHGFISKEALYQQVQDLCTESLSRSARLFNEYHALLVRLGKDYCRKRKPRCEICPLKQACS